MKFTAGTVFFCLLFITSLSAQGFGPEQLIANDSVKDIFAADLDGDGDKDMINIPFVSGASELSWQENLGSGVFGPEQLISNLHHRGICVFATDLDGDGDADVLACSYEDNKVAWYENRLNDPLFGDFGAQQIITTSQNKPRALSAADLDGDGDADILVGSRNDDKIAWYENRLNDPLVQEFGTEQQIINITNPEDVKAADIDGDGDLDVIAAGSGTGTHTVLWVENRINEPAFGDFGSQQLAGGLTHGVRSIDAADMDGDGDIDFVAAAWYSPHIVWVENVGSGNGFNGGTFAPLQLIAPDTISTATALGILASDLDGDGDIDVVASTGYSTLVMWYENLGGAIFDAAQVISTSFYGAVILASDLDGDQRPDIICGDNHIAWYPNQTSIWGLEIQETPSHDLNFSFSHGHPNTDYYAFYTLNTLNASSPNTGAFFGLHINMYTVWDQLSLAYSGNPIFGGVLDVSGAATAVYDQVGLGALSGLTVWAVTVQEVPSQPGVFEASPITDFTFL